MHPVDQTRQGEHLAIAKSIPNPSDGIGRGQLSVTAIVFNRGGIVVGTGQTPLPAAVLTHGSELPFTISLPDTDRIKRHRISFMLGQTGILHVDRRQRDNAACSAAPAPKGSRP